MNFCNQSHPFYSKLCNIFYTFCMTQVVSEHTHISSNGNASTIDLVAMTSPSLLSSCETTPSLSNSDTNIHLGLLT